MSRANLPRTRIRGHEALVTLYNDIKDLRYVTAWGAGPKWAAGQKGCTETGNGDRSRGLERGEDEGVQEHTGVRKARQSTRHAKGKERDSEM